LAQEIENWELVADASDGKLPIRRPLSWKDSSRQLMGHCLTAFHEERQEPSFAIRKAG
jgi:hypothetical protein